MEDKFKENTSNFIKFGSMLVKVIGPLPTDENGRPIRSDDLMPGKGYIYDNHVWVCKTDTMIASYPIAYYDPRSKGNSIRLIKPSPDEFQAWHVSNMVGNTFENALNVSADRIILSPDVIESMNNATSSYKPVIQENDDFLKRLVKISIRTKKVDLNRLKAKMAKSYGLSNLKSALKGTTKMSVTGFRTWMMLLGLDFTITCSNSKDLKDKSSLIELVYSSETDLVTEKGETRETNDKEDYLKRLVRLLIADKNVDSSMLKAKMSKAYGFSNLVQALTGSTKMSVTGFLTWLDLLDASAEFVIYDNGLDRLNPLPETMYYSTITDKITNEAGDEIVITNDEEEDDSES